MDLVNWKMHKTGALEDISKHEWAWELADLLKYVLCLAEYWEVSPELLLDASEQKSKALAAMWEMERKVAPPPNSQVLICDLDGTLADWRGSFIEWVHREYAVYVDRDPADTLMIDYDLQWNYPEYQTWKQEFERAGGYRRLHSYNDALDLVNQLQVRDTYIMVYTARPHKVRTVWWDTYQWLLAHGIQPHTLQLDGPGRIVAAHKLQQDRDVVMFDDDPELILRAANSGITVIARKHGYNAHIDHELVTLVESYSDVNPDTIF